MLYPSVEHVLRSTSFALETLVLPDPAGKGALSATATATHLLRYCSLRLAQEGAMLAEDIVALRTLLVELSDYLGSLGPDEPGAPDARRRIADALAAARQTEGCDVKSLAADARALREVLYGTQRLLQGAMRARRREEAAYRRVRDLIRSYIAAQLLQEERLIVPAFGGKGPRR